MIFIARKRTLSTVWVYVLEVIGYFYRYVRSRIYLQAYLYSYAHAGLYLSTYNVQIFPFLQVQLLFYVFLFIGVANFYAFVLLSCVEVQWEGKRSIPSVRLVGVFV